MEISGGWKGGLSQMMGEMKTSYVLFLLVILLMSRTKRGGKNEISSDKL